MISLTKESYLKDPCGASSLPFWKSEQIKIPANISIFREEDFDVAACPGHDEPYFKVISTFSQIPHPTLSDGHILTDVVIEELVQHINECYAEEGVSVDELKAYTERPVFDPSLWIAIRDRESGRIVASGIGEFDSRIGEGILEWIQVSPDHRRQGLGQIVVCELLNRLSGKADFVTVSGRVNNSSDPFSLYKSCGFGEPVIWHIVTSP